MSEKMEFTGERFVPQVHGNIELEHMHRYLMACEIATGKDVLDIASGEGYGSARMAQSAKHVYGVDISVESVEHAKSCYPLDNVSFLAGSCDQIPLPDHSVDLIVSFETIEHHDKHEEMMLEFKRVLRPGGALLISSPDKQVYSIDADYQNPFHVKELFADEFKDLLSKHFSNSAYFGQKITYGSAILEESGSSSQKSYWDHESQVLSKSGSRKPVYLLALASDGELPAVSAGIYERPESESAFAAYLYSVVAERDSQIESLHHELNDQNDTLLQVRLERDSRLAELTEVARERDDQIAMVHEREGQIARVNQIARDLKSDIARQQNEMARMGRVIESAKQWQKRSWFKRAFHRWRAPDSPVSKKNRLKQWEKSIRRRRDKLLGKEKAKPLEVKVTPASAITPAPVAKKKIVIHKDDGSVDLFVPKTQLSPPVMLPVKAICFYLPQFHEIPENNLWWGEGFTEWTNVKPAKPQYEGHYQPRVPGELGYYNLLDGDTQLKQIELAKLYGIAGFCFYFYWFRGTRLLEAPVLNYLADTSLDLPFCLCWANENWSRRWDGSDSDILISQDHSPEDDLEFIKYVSKYLRDPRYIRICGKPLLMVYRPSLLPDINETVILWRKWCRDNGIGEIYLAYTQSFEKNDPCEFGFDAAVEFPPNSQAPDRVENGELDCDSEFVGNIFDLKSLSERSANYTRQAYKLFRGVCPSWDNTARKKNRGTIFVNDRPEFYQTWLENAIDDTVETFAEPDERLVFINAWNEWAEGAHLEPDQKYGYAWLDATRKALEGKHSGATPRVLVIGHDAHMAGAQIVLLSLLREWRKTGDVSFDLILRDGGVFREQFESLAKTLVVTDYQAGEDLDQELSRAVSHGYDVVLSSTVTNGELLRHLRALGLRAPVITYSHELQKSIERWAGGGVMEMTVANSGRFIAGGTEVGRNLVKTHKVPENRLDIVHGFVDVWDDARIPDDAAREKLAEELGILADEIVIFGCGTTDWRKGPDLFLSIAERCCVKSDKIRFFWIGGESEEYNALAAKTACSKQIRFLPNALESRRYYYNGHIFLLSSREDPFPLVALEAADAGLPVVCFESAGGMPRFVKDDAGIVVPFEDVDAAANAIMALATDHDRRRSLGKNGQERVRACHSTPVAAAQVAEILRKTCGYAVREEALADVSTNAPLVTVIVPNYNHEKYLPQRLASIANQTFRDFEIILLDDCSTDNSLEVLREFESREPRARLIPNESNSGSTFKQWRKGVLEARGKYVWIAESDDSAEPELLDRLVERLESDPDISLACCQLRMMDPQGELGGTPDEWLGELDPERWKHSYVNKGMDEIRRYLSRKNTILNASGVVFRRFEGMESLMDVSMRLCADWLFWARLLSLGKIAYCAEPLNHWRLQTSNARTRPTGELEWEEGRRVIGEIARILNASPGEESEMLDGHRQKCSEWLAVAPSVLADHPVEETLDEDEKSSIFLERRGTCPVCEKEVTFISRSSWLRDHYFCSHCKSIPRERAIMHVIEKLYPNWRKLSVHESSPGNSGASSKLRAQCENYTATQYDPDTPFGSVNILNGHQSEDLENQTFEDRVFDIVVTQDVMEHVFDAEKAFKEVQRTLKPGGAHIFTTPLVNKEQPTQQRASLDEKGEVVYLHPAEYHGNPMSNEGSLVTWHWGYDIVDVVHKATGDEVELVDCHSETMGVEGEYIEVIVQKSTHTK